MAAVHRKYKMPFGFLYQHLLPTPGFHLPFCDSQRIVHVFVPRSREQDWPPITQTRDPNEAPLPAVFLFHGTDEMDPLDQELWSSEQEGWPLLSAQHQFVVIIGESVHWTQTVTDKPQAGWKPDTYDCVYADRAVDLAVSQYNVDPKRVYACGFSNGGLFVGELVLFSKKFAAACDLMGGFECCPWGVPSSDKHKWEAEVEQKFANAPSPRTPLLIFSSKKESNIKKCRFAKDLFESHDWPVSYIEQDNDTHYVKPEYAAVIWDFFCRYPMV